MDVIALRKTSGTITGEVKLNGHLQEADSFRRCSGYVYQFDSQTPQLTVQETVLFSARLRLDSSVPDSTKEKFVDQVLRMMELTPLADTLVGDDESGGLSFEQGKRLSIAVELAASPSILFLDGEYLFQLNAAVYNYQYPFIVQLFHLSLTMFMLERVLVYSLYVFQSQLVD